MKRFLSMLIAMAVLFSAGFALAEDDAYRPGEITGELVREAFLPGHHLSVSLSGIFEPGTGLAEDAEQQELLNGVSQLLENSALRLGYARVDGGARFEFGGYILGEDGSLVYSDNAATLTRDGVILESDMIEGRRLFVGYETLLAYAGLDDTPFSDAFLTLAAQDIPAYLRDWVESHSAQMLQMALPYAAVAAEWAGSLKIESVERLERDGVVYELPGMTQISVTDADMLRLLNALVDQFEKPDDAFRNWLAAIGPDPAAAVSALRNVPEDAADDVPMIFTFALPEGDAHAPFLADFDCANLSGVSVRCTLAGEPAQTEGSTRVTFRFSAVQAAADESSGDLAFSAAADLLVTEGKDDPKQFRVEMTAEADLNGESVFTMNYTVSNESFVAESGQPGYRSSVSETMQIMDPEAGPVEASSENAGEWVRTDEGGESFSLHGSSDTSIGGDSSGGVIVDTSFVIEPIEGGLFDASYSEIISMPALSIDAVGYSALIFGDEYEPLDAYLTTLYFEDLSGEEIAALESELYDAARGKRNDILEVLPEALLPYAVMVIGGQVPEDDHDALPDQGYLDGFMEGYGIGYDDGYQAGLAAASQKPDEETEALEETVSELVPENETMDKEEEELVEELYEELVEDETDRPADNEID